MSGTETEMNNEESMQSDITTADLTELLGKVPA